MMSLESLLERGGVWFNIPATTTQLFIKESIRSLHVPQGMDATVLLAQTLEREALVSTAMGRGIALPHPKTLLAATSKDSFVALVYPRFPLQWNSPDGQKVHAAFFIVSANQQEHLAALSGIAKLCSKQEFLEMLRNEAGLAELTGFIKVQG